MLTPLHHSSLDDSKGLKASVFLCGSNLRVDPLRLITARRRGLGGIIAYLTVFRRVVFFLINLLLLPCLQTPSRHYHQIPLISVHNAVCCSPEFLP